MQLTGQRVLVTGASSGLGRALSIRLAEAGAIVLATARRLDRLEALAEAYPSIEPHRLDLTDVRAIADFCADVGHLDGAVLNAGITAVEPFVDGSNIIDVAMVDTNIVANIRLTRGLVTALQGGRLVLVGSMAGEVALPYQAVYSGTKGFIRNFGLALGAEWAGDISVGVFAPGGIATEMTDIDAMEKLKGQLADVEEVASALMTFYQSEQRYSIPGRANRMSAYAARFLPAPLISRMMERVFRSE
ncbi:SDR family NAD(P)-dependent oxidoreductase [Algimonas porphyrae]|uniref:Short-chain dehydrogenase n=1 Tax=Algimonas porphyrae TaxID=1128113 RepID=A0ABQ5UW08_9PROT|nr:SDR family NAD(P)-dependent oxidoreductase [Algimonas porphyrae]GLQ19455.1 hypothetical protein GCM10007854_04100 [Algimonas porphyrae]